MVKKITNLPFAYFIETISMQVVTKQETIQLYDTSTQPTLGMIRVTNGDHAITTFQHVGHLA